MGLVKTRRLAAMQKQQRAKAGMKPQMKKGGALPPHLHKSGGKSAADLPRGAGIREEGVARDPCDTLPVSFYADELDRTKADWMEAKRSKTE